MPLRTESGSSYEEGAVPARTACGIENGVARRRTGPRTGSDPVWPMAQVAVAWHDPRACNVLGASQPCRCMQGPEANSRRSPSVCSCRQCDEVRRARGASRGRLPPQNPEKGGPSPATHRKPARLFESTTGCSPRSSAVSTAPRNPLRRELGHTACLRARGTPRRAHPNIHRRDGRAV